MKNPRLHFHSDCPFFAGCENMLVNFFESEPLLQLYDISFSYRFSEAYAEGYARRVRHRPRSVGLRLLDIPSVVVTRFGWPGEAFCRLVRVLLLLKVWFLIWNTFVLWRCFRRERIDLLHINNGGFPGAYSCVAAAFAGRLAGVRRIVMVVNNLAVPHGSFNRWLDRPFERLLARLRIHFVTGSNYAGSRLREVLPVPDERWHGLPNGIRERALCEPADAVRERLQCAQVECLLGVVANLETRKGHAVLLEALALLKRAGGVQKSFCVLCEGAGPEGDALARRATELGVGDFIRFIGVENRVFDFMRAMDVIVLPSIGFEDFPNVILEAMLLGKPVIATRIAGIPEQVEADVTGILVSPGDSAALAEAIRGMVNDEAQRLRMGREARAAFSLRFSWQRAVERYLKLYESLLMEDVS